MKNHVCVDWDNPDHPEHPLYQKVIDLFFLFLIIAVLYFFLYLPWSNSIDIPYGIDVAVGIQAYITYDTLSYLLYLAMPLTDIAHYALKWIYELIKSFASWIIL